MVFIRGYKMKKNRIIAIITALALLLSMAAYFALPAFAEESEKQEIRTAEELMALATGDPAGNYIQVADIDLSGKSFSPIGTPDAPFTGLYDGNGYTISGLNLASDQSFQGLFGVNCGEIRNLTLDETCSVAGSSYVGAVAGFNQGLIENCISRATVSFIAAEEDADAPVYGIMSQNLCQWGDNDLTADSSYVDSTTHSRRPGMIQRIQNSNPDILLFQEVSFKDYQYNGKTITAWDTFLRNTLTDFTICGTYRSNSDKEGVTIGFRKDKFELLEEGMFWLSENPDAPRSQQTKAWDAGCVRAAQFVVLQDKANGQQIIACSTHTDHVGIIARDKGSKLVAERMAALQKKYPDALLAVGGDFNNNPGSQGYLNMEAGINGLLDDSRYVAEERLNNIGTHGSITDLTYVGGELDTIDYIYVNSATTEVPTFYVMNDNYNDLRPSDHEGVFSTIKVRENHFVGGICGANGGRLSNIVAEGAVEGGEGFGSGAIVGNALYRAEWAALYAKEPSTDKMAGTPISLKAAAPEALPEIPSQLIVDLLNQTSGVFELQNGEYAILEGCGQHEMAKVVFKGVPKYCFVGSTFTFEVEEGLEVYLNGEPFEGRSFAVPSGGAVITVLEPIQSVTEVTVGGDFTIKNDEDFLYLLENIDYFRYRGVTIHQLYDIDLSKELLADFGGFENPAFSWEGYGHKIENWGSKEAPGGVGFYRINTGEGGANFIRNIRFSNIHVSGSNASVVYAVAHANGGLADLPTHLELSGISLDGCSMESAWQSSGMILSRYGSTGKDYTVDIFNIRITNCEMDANSWEHIGFVAGKIRTADGCKADFNISDCYLYNNIVVDAAPGVGFVGGSVEGQTYATFRNIGVFKNTAKGTGISYLVSDSNCAGAINGKGIIFAENTAETDAAYMVEGVYSAAAATLEDYWCDAELTALIEGQTTAYTATAPEVMASGEPGWAVNALQSAPSFWWAKDGSLYKPCGKEARLCKIAVNLGASKTYYLHMGETLALPDIGGNEYEIEGESTIEDGVLTVKGDTTISADIPVSMVESAVGGGDYTISSMEDWMALYENIAFFRNRNVTIHLLCDIDLSDERAAEFTCFENPAFSFDGHGNTIKNWGIGGDVAEHALFYVTDGNYGLNYIKNLNFSNCHLESSGGNQALLYCSAQGNDGVAGLPTTLSLENIRVDGCSIKSSGENAAFLLSRYGVAGADFTVNIRNCMVKNSSLDAGGSAHKGLLVGKARGTSNIGTFNIADCYLEGNTITNAVNGAGFIYGTAESRVSKVVIKNVGVINNSLTSEDAGAYAGYSDYNENLPVELKCVLFAGNTMNAAESYLVGSDSANATLTIENVYGDMTALNGAGEGAALEFKPRPKQVASGEAAWLLNQAMVDPLFYWGMSEGKPSLTDEDHQIAKITFILEDETVIKTLYLHGGEAVALSMEEDPEATFSLKDGDALGGENYTLPLGTKEQAILIHTAHPENFTPENRKFASEVTEAVTEGSYIIEDEADWMYVADHLSYFNSEDVTLVLAGDIDFSKSPADTFKGFSDAAFSLDGQGHKLSNWTALKESTDQYTALFKSYKGRKITNLKIEDCKVGGGYGRSLLISSYASSGSLELSNIQVKNCSVDATVSGNQMGLLIARPTATAASGAVITIKNCLIEGSTLKNTSGERINNSGLIVGSAYRNYIYQLSDIIIRDCRHELNTGAGGIVVGAVEDSSSVVMERIGVFHNSIQPNATNGIPGVFAGEMSGTASLALRGCMAAGNTADERNQMAMVCHFGNNSVAAINCFADFLPLDVRSTNNSDGITSGTPTILAGAEQLSASAFKNGEAAWKMNKKLGSATWLVGAEDGYPTFIPAAGLAAPFKVSFGNEAAYTNGLGRLSQEEFESIPKEEGHWLLKNALVAADAVYEQDTALVMAPHEFLAEEASPEGEAQHKMLCAAGCGAEKIEGCTFDQEVRNGDGQSPYHYCDCCCGNSRKVNCSLKTRPLGEGYHQSYCLDCSYEGAPEPCEFEGYAHVQGTETHIGTCSHCEAQSAPKNCEKIFMVDEEPEIGKKGSGHWLCTEGCGYYKLGEIAALGDCDGNQEITISDVVMLLRLLNGGVSIDAVDCVAGNVYKEDGYTANGGITTADALMLMKYVLK